MQQLAVTRVDRDMVDVAAATAKEHEIAGIELVACHGCGGRALRGGGARHANAEIGMHETDETTAVEPRRITAAESIRCAKLQRGTRRDLPADGFHLRDDRRVA